MIEGGFEARVELFEFLVALEHRIKLLLERKLQVGNLLVREGCGILITAWAVLPPSASGKLERTLTHVWPS
jgi:hypothetical protein